MKFDTTRDYHVGGRLGGPGVALDLNNPKSRARSVLDCSVRLTGDLWSEGDVQIDGHLCGNISCVQLIVSKDAVVTGVIIAHEAVIRGKTTGIIRATRVLLQGRRGWKAKSSTNRWRWTKARSSAETRGQVSIPWTRISHFRHDPRSYS